MEHSGSSLQEEFWAYDEMRDYTMLHIDIGIRQQVTVTLPSNTADKPDDFIFIL